MKEQFYQCRNGAVAAILLLGLALALNPGVTAQKQSHDGIQLRIAYEHGYRAGYADGYEAGKNDFADRMGRDYQRHNLYQEADRGYESRFGPLVDFKEGYSLGFEVGYFDGHVGRAFDSRIPPNVAHPGGRSAPLMGQKDRERRKPQPLVPEGALLRIRLETRLTTETNCEGDRFTARVIEPSEYEGAIIQGHISKIECSGRMSGAGAGAGSVYVQGDKDLMLEPGAQMIVRADYPAR